MTLYIGDKPVGLYKVVEKKVPKLKYGVSIDNFLGDVDENGVYSAPSIPTYLNFAGVKEIQTNSLKYTFAYRQNIVGADLGSVTSINNSGMYHTFDGCQNLASANLGVSVVDSYGLEYTFYGCNNLTVMQLDSLTEAKSNSMRYTFYNTGISGIVFRSLVKLGSNAMSCAFRSCSKLVSVSFPALTTVEKDSFGSSSYLYCFYGDNAITEIHFRADMQATIEAMTGYGDKWGATNATIYFSL